MRGIIRGSRAETFGKWVLESQQTACRHDFAGLVAADGCAARSLAAPGFELLPNQLTPAVVCLMIEPKDKPRCHDKLQPQQDIV
jgi:hypothetical protein